jgi:hypothetical protein
MQVYHAAIWSEPVPDLVQDAVLHAFEDSGRIEGVARRGTGVSGDYELLLDVRRFESDYNGGSAPNAEVEFTAKLIANRTNQVIATRTLRRRRRSATCRARSVVRCRAPCRSSSAGRWRKGRSTTWRIRRRRPPRAESLAQSRALRGQRVALRTPIRKTLPFLLDHRSRRVLHEGFARELVP